MEEGNMSVPRPRVGNTNLLHTLNNASHRVQPDEDFGEIGKVRQARTVLGYGEDAVELYRQGKAWWEHKTRWSVSVDSKDRLYDAVLRWFLESDSDAPPPRAIKAVLGQANKRDRLRAILDDEYGSVPSEGIDVYYDEKGTREIAVDGHRIVVSLYRPEQIAAAAGESGFRSIEPDRIQFHAKSHEGQDAILNLLREIAANQNVRKPGLHLMSQWGDWQRRDDLPSRQLDSVVLAEGQMERIRDDLAAFLEQEPEYARRGSPYHRGYLLYGPPGTGKTSIVRALAAHFGLDLWYAPLGDLQKDTSLIGLINQVRSGSILLLEDVDVFHATRQREEDGAGVSMAGLLNALDGVATPHGLIVFMTTNDLSVIDDAVIRPGRIDIREEIGYPDQDQIARLWESWYGMQLDPGGSKLIQYAGTTAGVTELFKQHFNDATAALTALQCSDTSADVRSVTVREKGTSNGRREEGRIQRRKEGPPF